MSRIQIIPVGQEIGPGLLRGLSTGLTREFAADVDVREARLDPSFAYNPERRQYHSSEILARLAALPRDPAARVLGVTVADLYIPILTFVFGEAEMRGALAIVSTHRLRQEFYGLPADPDLLEERLIKESVHEIGHTIGLAHCDDYDCVMASSHAVEWIDLKGRTFCPACRARVFSPHPKPKRAWSF